MNKFFELFKRNVKLFFKDKGLFFTSLITPLILLVLYATFLSNVFKSTYSSIIPETLNVPEKVINGLAGGQLMSSLLAVSCVTVSFCSNMLMVQDKISGARKDLLMTGVSKSTMSISYYLSTFFVTLIIALVATLACFIYLIFVGWYITFIDCILIFLDVIILTMFGTVLSSIVNFFLSSQGQVSAVGSIVSSMYGFISGAYMPIASFGVGLQKVLTFLPSTYGTALIRNHCMRGAINELSKYGVNDQLQNIIKDSIDCNVYFFDIKVSILAMYLILIFVILLLVIIYVMINKIKLRKVNK